MEELKIGKSFDGTIITIMINGAVTRIDHDIEYYSSQFGLDDIENGEVRTFKLQEVK